MKRQGCLRRITIGNHSSKRLITKKEVGRVFNGGKEGKIMFAPIYKYSHNSSSYYSATTLTLLCKSICYSATMEEREIENIYVREYFVDHQICRSIILYIRNILSLQ